MHVCICICEHTQAVFFTKMFLVYNVDEYDRIIETGFTDH